jgi:hypothetical protein
MGYAGRDSIEYSMIPACFLCCLCAVGWVTARQSAAVTSVMQLQGDGGRSHISPLRPAHDEWQTSCPGCLALQSSVACLRFIFSSLTGSSTAATVW